MAAQLFVYGDESGKKDQSVVIVAGFIASPRQWDSFNRAWRQVLDQAEVAEFHAKLFSSRHAAKDGNSRRNPYSDWSAVRAKTVLDQLLAVMHDHRRVVPQGSLLDAKAFFEFTWGERNYLTGASWDKQRKRFVRHGAPSSTYHTAFFNFVGNIVQEAKLQDDCKVHFYMDEDKVIENHVVELFRAARSDRTEERVRHALGDLTPARSQDYEGIQAADFIAYLWRAAHALGSELSGERHYATKRLIGDVAWEGWHHPCPRVGISS